MTEKPVNSTLKAVLEYGPLIIFLGSFFLLKDRHLTIGGTDYKGIIIVTAVFIVVMVLATLILWRLSGRLSSIQIFSLASVLLMGGLTIYLNDERYLKMKPTLYYMAVAGILGVGLLQGKSYLKVVLGPLTPLKDEGWMILTRRFAAFFLGLAVLNEVVWRNTSTETWVLFKVFGFTALLFGFFLSQAGLLQRFAAPEGETPKPAGAEDGQGAGSDPDKTT